MAFGNRNSMGFAVVIAWPATFCKQPTSWYDPITSLLGFSKNNYYKAGHAALVLVDISNLRFHYFDFGRYHAPFNHGRVRSAETDHELEIEIRPAVSSDGKTLLNYKELINVLQSNPGCHGAGTIYTSYTGIDFNLAYNKAIEIQARGAVPYGPFLKGGSNCSRFVFSSLLAGKPNIWSLIKLRLLIPLTPTPMSNVRAFNHRYELSPMHQVAPFFPSVKPDKIFLGSTLESPERHNNIPTDAQWIAGEGAGSWFDIVRIDSYFRITRYSPDGEIECKGNFNGETIPPSVENQKPEIGYISNCRSVTLTIDGVSYLLERI